MKEHEHRDEILAQSALEGLRIRDASVASESGVLYVRGKVACYEKKRLATQRILALIPSADIVNEIRVLRNPLDDESVQREVTQALAVFDEDVSQRVKVDVNAGVVWLRGSARDEAERNAIEAAAWEVCGVHRVDNRLLTASAGLTEAEVEQHLNEYVAATFRLPPGAVSVAYQSGQATLSGTATTPAERNAIEELVRWHDRVDDVVNGLEVVNQPLAVR